MTEIAEWAEPLGQFQRFRALGEMANVSRRCELGLESVACGFGCWGTFCKLTANISLRREERRWRGQPMFQLGVPSRSFPRIWKRLASLRDTALNGSRRQWPKKREA